MLGNRQKGNFHFAGGGLGKNVAQLIATVVFAIGFFYPDLACSSPYTFVGGPVGGTYTLYADAVATLSSKTDVPIRALVSRGSIDNIKKVHTGMANFGIAYSGDIFKGRNGQLKNDIRKYRKVMAVAYFYSAPAQLVVRSESGIDTALKLVSHRVGVGNQGSGAAGNCELFFRELNIWDKIYKRFLGYNKASLAFRAGEIDAFWLFAGFPNSSVSEAAASSPIQLVNLFNDAETSGLLKTHPYFSRAVIPANTYKGVATDTVTFQDSTVWIVNSRVPSEDVYSILSAVYSAKGLEFMAKAHGSAKAMNVPDGIKGIVTPLHPGAERFWNEKGLVVPVGLSPDK